MSKGKVSVPPSHESAIVSAVVDAYLVFADKRLCRKYTAPIVVSMNRTIGNQWHAGLDPVPIDAVRTPCQFSPLPACFNVKQTNHAQVNAGVFDDWHIVNLPTQIETFNYNLGF